MQSKIIKLFFFFLLFIDVVFASELKLTSEKYILYNMNDNSIILEKDSHEKASLASLTKLMTIIVSIENIKDYNKKIKITSNMLKDIEWDVAVAGFKVGDTVTYNDLLYGAMLPSGADAVNALAISISGSKDKFIKLMNKKAKELNLDDTHFANVVGLYDKENYSTAYDISQLLIYCLKNKKFKEVFETRVYKLSTGKPIKSTLEKYNTSNLDTSFIKGSKTGYISAAGYCLASCASLNNVNYLFVSLNAFSNKSNIHIQDHVKTYKYYDSNYSYKSIVEKDDIITTIKTTYAKENNIKIKANTEIKKYLSNDFNKSKIEYAYNGINSVSYFTKNNIKLGTVSIKYNGEELDSFDVYYNEKLTFSIASFILINKTNVIVIIIMLILFIVLSCLTKKRKKHYC